LVFHSSVKFFKLNSVITAYVGQSEDSTALKRNVVTFNIILFAQITSYIGSSRRNLKLQVGVNATPRPLYPLERHGTHCIGVRLVPRTGLGVYGKTRPRLDSIPGPTIPKRAAIPTELSRPSYSCNNLQLVASHYTH
jgi:hypothetical protein